MWATTDAIERAVGVAPPRAHDRPYKRKFSNDYELTYEYDALFLALLSRHITFM